MVWSNTALKPNFAGIANTSRAALGTTTYVILIVMDSKPNYILEKPVHAVPSGEDPMQGILLVQLIFSKSGVSSADNRVDVG